MERLPLSKTMMKSTEHSLSNVIAPTTALFRSDNPCIQTVRPLSNLKGCPPSAAKICEQDETVKEFFVKSIDYFQQLALNDKQMFSNGS